MKWGIIGPGNIAEDFIKDMKYVPDSGKVVAALGRRKEKTDEFAKQFHIEKSFTDLDKFIKEGGVDIVYIATPHTLHFDAVIDCLNHGIHVLCEKPMGINEEQYGAMYELAAKKNLFILEGMWLRYLPHIHKLLELIHEDRIGKIISVRASMCYKAPKDPDSRYFYPELGGGSLLDLGIYTVFLALLVAGKPDGIKAVGHLSDQGIDETCTVLFDYRRGANAILESSLLYNNEQPAVITGEKGQIHILNPWFEKSDGLELHVEGKDVERIATDWEGHGLQFEIREVVKCIREGRTTSELYPPEFSLQVIKIMDEIREQINVVYDSHE